jgi:uncharacterized membrane protein YccF (DUF307 family)
MGKLSTVLWFLLGPWWVTTALHQDLHDTVNLIAWVGIGLCLALLDGADAIAAAIKER